MSINKLEDQLYDWWLNLSGTLRQILRVAICLFVAIIPGIIHQALTGNTLNKTDPLVGAEVTLGFLLLMTLSILWTRASRDRKSLQEVNEVLTELDKKKSAMNEELASMNEELAKWNMEATEACRQLEESQRLLKEAHAELQRISNYDALTVLYSRHYYESNKPRLEAEARRHGWCFWAVSLDLNKLKAVNDTFGHAAGDKFLCFFAEKLLTMVRNTDLCARVGGDEFCILGNDNEAGVAEHLVARILKSMESWFIEINGVTIKVSAAVGYASTEFNMSSTETIDNIIDLADQRMYEHKNSTRER